MAVAKRRLLAAAVLVLGWFWLSHRDRWARSGVRWWRILGLGVWLRDTRILGPRAYDPRWLIHAGPYLVALTVPVLHRRKQRARTVEPRPEPEPATETEEKTPQRFRSVYPALRINGQVRHYQLADGAIVVTEPGEVADLLAVCARAPYLLTHQGEVSDG